MIMTACSRLVAEGMERTLEVTDWGQIGSGWGDGWQWCILRAFPRCLVPSSGGRVSGALQWDWNTRVG